MGAYNSTFLRKLREFDTLIKFASRRYRIPGVLDPEDLYQEGLMILDSVFRDIEIGKYSFDPDSPDFRKVFKTELWHGLWKVLQHHKAQKRDFKRTLPGDISETEDYLADEFELPDFLISPSPEARVLRGEEKRKAEDFLHQLSLCLDEEENQLLTELTKQRKWDEIPEEHLRNTMGDKYWRVQKKRVPQNVIANILGWSVIRVRRTIKRIRRQAMVLAKEKGVSLKGYKLPVSRKVRSRDKSESRT